MTDFSIFAEREKSGWSEPDIVAAYVDLRHRIVPNFQAEADGRATGDIVDELLQLSRKWM